MDRHPTSFTNFLLKMFSLDIPSFSRIVIRRDVLDDIAEFARTQHPREFVALLGGRVKSDELTVDSLVYQPFQSSQSTSIIIAPVPAGIHVIGSVHSHPSSNAHPSKADLAFFNKRGVVHLIISNPYAIENVHCYDLYGHPLSYKIQ
jgi:proteasome lid subunit RPN8/RPN11